MNSWKAQFSAVHFTPLLRSIHNVVWLSYGYLSGRGLRSNFESCKSPYLILAVAQDKIEIEWGGGLCNFWKSTKNSAISLMFCYYGNKAPKVKSYWNSVIQVCMRKLTFDLFNTSKTRHLRYIKLFLFSFFFSFILTKETFWDHLLE